MKTSIEIRGKVMTAFQLETWQQEVGYQIQEIKSRKMEQETALLKSSSITWSL